MEDRGQVPGSSDFGTLLRRYRLAAGLSQEALAERARMSTQGISALERGYRRTPQRETLALLAGSLTLTEGQREEFDKAAARSVLLGRRAPVTVGPWAGRTPATLPIALTSFVGREAELHEIAALVREHRMVTLTGFGGIGKTQTALHVATAQSATTGIAVCFVGLASIGNPSLVVASIASALGAQEVPDRPLLATAVAYLKSQTLLLILDNCEHVISEAATVAGALLGGCPHLRILATSREPLRAAGEHSYRLPSLRIPSTQARHRLGAKDAATYEAILLFTDRVRAVDHRFTLTDENAPIVAAICQRLDGIPLAIELAAARVNQLPVETIAERLDDRFRILTGGERTALPRQQTMRAAIDWSYDLLSAREQRVFERLSVFAGGCTLAAAATVCESQVAATADMFDVLSSLVDKSLSAVAFEGREPRYRLLESAKAYARDKLIMQCQHELLARRHAIAYVEIAEELDAAFNTERDPIWTSHARAELDNWRAALEWALARRGDVTVGQRLVGALRMVWIALAPLEGCRWIDLALDSIDGGTPANVVARIRHARALAASRLNETEKEFTNSQKALALYQNLGDELGIALCQTQLGNALRRLGRGEEAEPVLLEAIARLRHLDAPRALAYTLRVMSQAYANNGDFTNARRHLAESVALYNGLEAYRLAAFAISGDLAPVELTAGNAELALGHASDALPILKACNDMHSIADVLNIMSACLVSLDRYDAAEAYARESLTFSSELNYSFGVATSLHRLAAVSALRTQGACEPCLESCARGAVVFGFVDARLAELGSPREAFDRQEYERALAALRGSMGSNQLATLMNEGATMSEEQAVNEALGDGV